MEPSGRDRLPPPPDDTIEQRRVVAEADARLFGGEPAPVRVGRFEVRGRLGMGGLGVVYSAYDPDLDRAVALKLVRVDRVTGESADQERMLREARAMARLAHPNVVAVYEVGVHDGRVFVAMERVDGWTLRTWLDEVRPRNETKVATLLEAGRGLAAAHAAGLVHRDFKPENVLVGRDGRARVTDFGLARPEGAAADVAGTPAYMAPEQRAGEPATRASDQFAFCATAWEVLSGSRPSEARDAPGAIDGERIRRALRRGLEREARDRWPSMEALLEALAGTRAGRARRVLAAVVITIAVGVALIAALLQMWMFRDWIGRSRP